MSIKTLGPDLVSVLDTIWDRGPSTVGELARIHGVDVEPIRRLLFNAHGRGLALIESGAWVLTTEGFLFLERVGNVDP